MKDQVGTFALFLEASKWNLAIFSGFNVGEWATRAWKRKDANTDHPTKDV